MERLYGVITTVSAMAVLCTLLEFCVPTGNLKRSVRIVSGLMFVLAVAQPVVALCADVMQLPRWQGETQFTQYELLQDHTEWLKQTCEQIGRTAE